MVYFTNTSAKITPESYGQRIKSITVHVFLYDCTGEIYITDLLLQGGSIATG